MAREDKKVWVVLSETDCEGETSSDISGHEDYDAALEEFKRIAAAFEGSIISDTGQPPIYINDNPGMSADQLQDSWVADESVDENEHDISFFRYGEYSQNHMDVRMKRISIQRSTKRTPLKKPNI